MNERIEHITKQVDEYFDDLTIDFSREAWQAKFAELIVKECVETIELNTSHISKRGIGEIHTIVKQHFRVE